MKISKFIIPAATLLVGAALGVVYGVKNADGIKDAIKAGKEAADEKVRQLREAAEEAKKKVSEATEDEEKKEVEELVDEIGKAAAEVVDGNFQPQPQPRGKDGRFVKA